MSLQKTDVFVLSFCYHNEFGVKRTITIRIVFLISLSAGRHEFTNIKKLISMWKLKFNSNYQEHKMHKRSIFDWGYHLTQEKTYRPWHFSFIVLFKIFFWDDREQMWNWIFYWKPSLLNTWHSYLNLFEVQGKNLNATNIRKKIYYYYYIIQFNKCFIIPYFFCLHLIGLESLKLGESSLRRTGNQNCNKNSYVDYHVFRKY